MKLLKRILASLIDLSVLVVSILIIYPLLNNFKIELEQKYFLLLAFSVSYFFPISILKNSVGRCILKINTNSTTRLLIKYLFYYLIFSGLIAQYIGLITELTPLNYRPIQVEIHLLYIIAAFFVINILFFLFSVGEYNLIDFILNLSYSNKGYKRHKYLFLLSWLSILYLTVIFEVSGRTSFFTQYMNQFINGNLNYNYTKYFPKEKFDEYSYFQIEKIEESNTILSFSSQESFLKNSFMTQKIIFVLINKSTFENVNKRFQLCQLLNIYSEINDLSNSMSDINNEVQIDQTKIILLYIKPETYFSHESYSFCYYYDNKNPKYSYYGGIQTDSLINSYKNHIFGTEIIYKQSAAKALKITTDSLIRRFKKDSTINLSKKQYQSFVTEYNKAITKRKFLVITTIPFIDVKPIVIRSINLNHNIQEIEYNYNQNWDNKFYEAVAWRDIYEQND